ncbi:amidohydrolase [Oceanirhabdus seepicola]|uniref:Amidohydrolase n=1 Tax=Oceanirhabdus seepicola TaxID=2828781 RepID=A0A9J6P699_9CLOT|nr:amidohydrolase [Oceanirhabdus seepicola]MCM1991788.1 amidohydrolase [Oceanirhabdus seepicola]
MKKIILIVLITCITFAFLGCDGNKSKETNERERSKRDRKVGVNRVFINGAVYTANKDMEWAEAVVIKEGIITFVGSNVEAEKYIDDNTEIIDLKGKSLLPGFHDTHVHPFVMMGTALSTCNMFSLKSKDEYLEAIYKASESQKDREYVIGMGFNLENFGEEYPTKYDLDEIIPDKPAVFIDNAGHAAWANSKMLEVAGIHKETIAEYGVIVKDENGEPTGLFLEDDAMNLVTYQAFELSTEEMEKGLKKAVEILNQAGVTSFVEAQVNNKETDKLYTYVDKKGELNARVNLALWVDPAKGDSQLKKLKSRQGQLSPRVKANQVKLLLDGTLEMQTAALIEPYYKSDNNTGMLTFNQERLNEYCTELEALGFSIHMHAAGDKATRHGLDALEYAKKFNQIDDTRHILCHLYLVDDNDIERFNKLNVIANYQAFWAQPFMYGYEESLGKERIEKFFPFKTLKENGALITMGSDWPVTTYEPLKAIEVAVTRKEVGASNLDYALNENESIALEEVIDAYTINGAYLMRQEDITGSIEVGKKADLVVLSENIFDIPSNKISETKVMMTFLEGKIVYIDSNYLEN